MNNQQSYSLKELVVGAVIVITSRSIIDIPTALVALLTIIILVKFKKIQEPHVIIVAALFGIIYKMFVC